MTGESGTSQLSDRSMRFWIIKLYFVFIYSAWICIYKHSYIHILPLTLYWSIIAATPWCHSVLPSPKSAAARDYEIGSLLEFDQPWEWCWTHTHKEKLSGTAVWTQGAWASGNSTCEPVHRPLSTRVWPSIHLMRWLHLGTPNLLSQNMKNLSIPTTSHREWG